MYSAFKVLNTSSTSSLEVESSKDFTTALKLEVSNPVASNFSNIRTNLFTLCCAFAKLGVVGAASSITFSLSFSSSKSSARSLIKSACSFCNSALDELTSCNSPSKSDKTLLKLVINSSSLFSSPGRLIAISVLFALKLST